MTDLTSEQLEAIRRLLIDPLREAIRQEIRLGHQRLAATLERVIDRTNDHERRLMAVEKSTARLRAFRRRVVAIYGFVTLLLSIAWAILRDKVLGRFDGK
jgi:hypothetical protein